jgi:hypothetical protein
MPHASISSSRVGTAISDAVGRHTGNSENLIRLVSGVGTRIPLDGREMPPCSRLKVLTRAKMSTETNLSVARHQRTGHCSCSICWATFEPPGFFLGFVHGIISPFALIAEILANVRVYASPNSGGSHDFGLMLGVGAVGAFFGGGAAAS